MGSSRGPAATGPLEDHPPLAVAGVVLAAGRSTRMGDRNKLLEAAGRGPMVEVVVRRLLRAEIAPVVVVTGHEAERVEAVLERYPAVLVRNARFEEGMGTSVASGVSALGEGIAGALLCLGDMPLVREATLRALRDAFCGAAAEVVEADGTASGSMGTPSIWVPVLGGRRGNPVLWSARWFAELRSLSADVGGRAVIEEHDEAVREVELDDPGILLDIDTPEALRRAHEAASAGI